MTETQPTPLSTADVKRRYSWGMAPHKSIPGGMYTVAAAAADFERWLAVHDAEVRADERAKRPDRQQIYKAIREEAKSVDSPCPPWLASRYADAVLALEPEAREVTDAEVEAARVAYLDLDGLLSLTDALRVALEAAREVSRG